MTARPRQFDADVVAIMPRLKAYAISKLRDGDRAQDIVQRVAVRALRAWEQFTPGTNFTGWMYRILHNEIMSEFRRQKRSPVPLEAADIDTMATRAAPQDAVVDDSHIRRVIEMLPLKLRHVLLRVCVEERSYEEVAAEIDVSVGTIRSRLWRARAAVEQILVM